MIDFSKKTGRPARLTAAFPVVSLVGLSEQKTSHQLIQKFITNPQKHSITFLRRPLDHIYLKSSSSSDLSKTLDTSGSNLDGILRADWLPNQLSQKPQVVAFFIELSWFDPNFNEKALEYSSQVSILKSSVSKNVKIALVVIQPENSETEKSDPLNNKERLAAGKLKHLADTVGISDQHIAQINLDKPEKIEKSCNAVKDGLLRMVGLVVEDKIKNLKAKINNTSKNSLSLLKMHVRYQLKLGVFYEIKCELENTNSNERNCFKAYRTSYALLDDVYKERRKEGGNFLDLGALEVLALARLISGRLIQFSLVQDLSINEAVLELLRAQDP